MRTDSKVVPRNFVTRREMQISTSYCAELVFNSRSLLNSENSVVALTGNESWVQCIYLFFNVYILCMYSVLSRQKDANPRGDRAIDIPYWRGDNEISRIQMAKRDK